MNRDGGLHCLPNFRGIVGARSFEEVSGENRGYIPVFNSTFQKNTTNIQLIFQFCNYFFSLLTDFSVLLLKIYKHYNYILLNDRKM
jgi:hypothetical protein